MRFFTRHHPNLLSTLLLLALVGLAAGCGETEPEPPTLTGTWIGVTDILGADVEWTARLSESETGFVRGDLHAEWWPLSLDIEGTGTHAYPHVNLTLFYSIGRIPVNGKFDGTLETADLLRGTLTVGDLFSVTLNLERTY